VEATVSRISVGSSKHAAVTVIERIGITCRAFVIRWFLSFVTASWHRRRDAADRIEIRPPVVFPEIATPDRDA
jgi:hypothetical protein